MKIIITERQNNLLMENLPASFRRRYNYDEIKSHLDFTLSDSINPCEFDSITEFIGDICNMMVDDFLDDFNQETGDDVDYKAKDNLYYFMVDNFKDYLRDFYIKQCH
jgi:hypothetical protein